MTTTKIWHFVGLSTVILIMLKSFDKNIREQGLLEKEAFRNAMLAIFCQSNDYPAPISVNAGH